MMGFEDIEGKVVWVTGAAGAIGDAICRQLAECGAVLAMSGRDEAKLNLLLESLPKNHHRVIRMDITERHEVDNAAQLIEAAFGRIDVLVNSTTCPVFRPFSELDDDDWLAVLDAKLLGYMRTCRAAIPRMIKAGGGTVVNVSGRGGHQPSSPSHFAGSCANGGVNTLTKGLALHFMAQGIRANAVAPGPVASERYSRIATANHAIATETGSVSAAAPTNPDLAKPEFIADIVAFLVSDRSRHLNGVVLQTDGGTTMAL